MANIASLSSSQSSTVGPWAEFTLAANVVVQNGTTANTFTVGIPISGSGSAFNPNLPISVCTLNQAGIQGAINQLPAGLGLTSAILTNSTTITLTFVNNNSTGANININTNVRMVCMQIGGI